MWQILLWLSAAHHISFQFFTLIAYSFPFQNVVFYLALLKDRYLKKMLLKRAKPMAFIFAKLLTQIIILLYLKTI